MRHSLSVVGATARGLCALTLNNATINANLGTPGNFSALITDGVTRLANCSFTASDGGFRTLASGSRLIFTRNTIGTLTTSVVGVTGSIH